jgi:hypothetical protein
MVSLSLPPRAAPIPMVMSEEDDELVPRAVLREKRVP